MSHTPPIPPRREHIREHHGDRVLDPYAWLADLDDPEVLAHLTAENAYAEAMTAGLEPLRGRLFEEIRSRVKETDLSVPVGDGPWWYYSRTAEGQQYPIHCRAPRTDPAARPDPTAESVPGEQVLLDANAAAEGHEFFALGALAVSADHGRLAYSVDTTGDERFALTVVDLATGDILDEAVEGLGYGCEFSLDGRHVFYLRVDEAWRPHQLWRHEIGTPAETDVLCYEEGDERFWMGLGGSRDDRWLILAIGSKTTSEVRLLDAADPTGEWRVVAPRRDGVEYDVEPAGDRLLIVHNADHPDSDLAWAPLEATSAEQWQPVAPHVEGERLTGVEAFDDFALVSLRRDGLTAVRVLPREPGQAAGFGAGHDIAWDEPLYTIAVGDTPENSAHVVQIVVESMVTPRSVYDYDVDAHTLTLLKRQPVLGGFDPADYTQRREWALAEDGTRVPISLVCRAGTEPDGTSPGLLTAYGAYEISSDPYFSVARLSLLERGVVYAVAHPRGGGEMGRAWYEGGKELAKPTTFSDVVACARHLVDTGWVAPDRLALEGGSAGGLMVGAVLNAAPGLFTAAHAQVPFVDALTTVLDPSLPLTVVEWEEWGDPLHDPDVYACMKGYSPYENIGERPYPAVLATTSLHDTRVSCAEPAKWVARLRELTAPTAERPVLLRVEMSGGHGGRSGRYEAWRQIAWEWAWLLDRLGCAD
ncbi:MAG: S9 family peptidase [Micrococcales bacterium]|nr:S9 family peptidase [Micrococcales bacterium]